MRFLTLKWILLDAKTLGQAKAILDDGFNYYGSITRDGSFVMCVMPTSLCHDIHERDHRPDVPEGTYILNIVARNHLFDQVRINPFPLESRTTELLSSVPNRHRRLTFTPRGPPIPPGDPPLVDRELPRYDHVPLEGSPEVQERVLRS